MGISIHSFYIQVSEEDSFPLFAEDREGEHSGLNMSSPGGFQGAEGTRKLRECHTLLARG